MTTITSEHRNFHVSHGMPLRFYGACGRCERGEKLDQPPAVDPLQRDQVIRALRADLKRRTGRTWSVTGGTGTAWGWITIQAPPARRSVGGSTVEDDRSVLAAALGLSSVHHQGVTIPAGTDYRLEYLDRAAGRTPAKLGTPYWD